MSKAPPSGAKTSHGLCLDTLPGSQLVGFLVFLFDRDPEAVQQLKDLRTRQPAKPMKRQYGLNQYMDGVHLGWARAGIATHAEMSITARERINIMQEILGIMATDIGPR